MKTLVVLLALTIYWCVTTYAWGTISAEDRSAALDAAPQFFAFDVNNPQLLNDTQHAILYAIHNCIETSSSECDMLDEYTYYVIGTAPERLLNEETKAKARDVVNDLLIHQKTHTLTFDVEDQNELTVVWSCDRILPLNLFHGSAVKTLTAIRVTMCNRLHRHIANVKKQEAYWKEVEEKGFIWALFKFIFQTIYYSLLMPVCILFEFLAIRNHMPSDCACVFV